MSSVGQQLGRRAGYWWLRSQARAFQYRRRRVATDVMLGRVACMGQDVLQVLAPTRPLLNIQKGRIDYLTACADNDRVRARPLEVLPHLEKMFVADCIVQEGLVVQWWRAHQPSAVFMDSFAELTDQCFENRRAGWRFVSAFGDVHHSDHFGEAFRPLGLMPVERFLPELATFFGSVRKQFGPVPIFYLHFPVTFEERPQFRERYAALNEAVETLGREFAPLISLSVDDALVTRPDNPPDALRDFPYHYGPQTYEHFARLVRGSGFWY